MPTEERVFRLPVMAAVRGMLTYVLLVGIGLAVAVYFGTLSVTQLILVIVLLAVVVIPIGVLAMRALDVRVSADGIKAHGYGLRAILVPWNAITEVRKSFEGVRVLVLETVDKKQSVLVPIAIAKQPGFLDAIVRHAGAGHRLVQVLLESVT